MLSTDPEDEHFESYSVDEQQSENSILTEWIGMGRSGPQNLAKRQLWNCITFTMVLLSLLLRPAHCQQCRIQRCNAEYVASTSPSSGLQEDSPSDVDYCIALRAYALCTRRTARSCRGDLVYHSAVFRIKELFTQHNCSSDGPTSSAKAPSTSRPVVSELCDYESRVLASGPAGQGKKYAHCGLFGDPHLRTFRDEFQTCKVEGAWPLIDNRYLSVQVTNVPVVLGSSATATSKITVIFKSYHGCTEQKVYQATTEDLPSAFQDGSRTGGEGGSLWIVEKVGAGGRLVTIQARYIGTSIIVRRVGRYLTFAIRMPEDTLDFSEENSGLQLCLHGCPRNELIKEHTLGRQPLHPRLPGSGSNPELGPLLPPHQIYTVERATAKCRETLQVEDIYFQSCVFDLLTTGDPEFSMAAYGALEDLKALPPSKLKQNSPRAPHVQQNRGGPHTLATATPSLVILLLLVLLLL
ncbi:repulsive guidance molecule A isoform X1 [Salmo trutta]|uniref:RGM domain family, member D n=1 Tax=Salmo trutta TaxID=8032 RepID=A0A674E0L9_SALTR|nr:repulsive guidance molecule A-like isoform X1 [Salmo trutta]